MREAFAKLFSKSGYEKNENRNCQYDNDRK